MARTFAYSTKYKCCTDNEEVNGTTTTHCILLKINKDCTSDVLVSGLVHQVPLADGIMGWENLVFKLNTHIPNCIGLNMFLFSQGICLYVY